MNENAMELNKQNWPSVNKVFFKTTTTTECSS